MFTIINQKILIKENQFQLYGKSLSSAIKKGLCEGVLNLVKTNDKANPYELEYIEVSSTSTHVKFQTFNGINFWLDLESKYVYQSPYPLSYYFPWFSLEKSFEGKSEGMWSSWSNFLISNTSKNTDDGSSIVELIKNFLETYKTKRIYQPENSRLSNYVAFKESESLVYNNLSVKEDLAYTSFSQYYSFDFVDFIVFFRFLGLAPKSQVLNVFTPVSLTLLEDSFQSFYLKDMIGALLMEQPLETIKVQMEKAGIFDILPELKKHFSENSIDDFLSLGQSVGVDAKNLTYFPFELIQMQVSKINKRFKLRGVL